MKYKIQHLKVSLLPTPIQNTAMKLSELVAASLPQAQPELKKAHPNDSLPTHNRAKLERQDRYKEMGKSFTTREWKRRKVRMKLAKESRRRNRK